MMDYVFIIKGMCQEVLTNRDADEVQTLGITSLWIASKFEEIQPLYLARLVDEVMLNQIKEEEFMKTE